MKGSRLNIQAIMLIAILTMLCGCKGGRTTSFVSADASTADGDTIEMRYAKLLRMVRLDGQTVHVDIVNPWNTSAVLRSYDISAPFGRAAVSSSVHCSLIDELGKTGCISGVFDAEYCNNDNVRKALDSGKILNFGNSMAPDMERLIDASPDALLLIPFENGGVYGTMDQLGVPVIECADYMEEGPLARAEWMKFYGLLFGCYDEACALFDQVEAEYDALMHEKGGKSVVLDLITGSTWYQPGGNSTIGLMLTDAGADYPFAGHPQQGSLALSPETVFDECQDADVWLIRYTDAADKTYDQLARDNRMYGQMQAYKNRSVYGCNLQYVRFFEETPFHPERLLKDFVKIFHPDELPDYELKYFTPLSE